MLVSDGDDAAVGDGNAVGVAAKILRDVFGSGGWVWFTLLACAATAAARRLGDPEEHSVEMEE